MSKGYTIPLSNTESRTRACQLIAKAPDGHLCRVTPPTRTLDQNAKMHAMLTDISLSKPGGRKLTPDDWKCLMMHACGWESQFLEGLDGRPFPTGFRSSRLSKSQMSDLIEFMQSWGDQNNVRWTERG